MFGGFGLDIDHLGASEVGKGLVEVSFAHAVNGSFRNGSAEDFCATILGQELVVEHESFLVVVGSLQKLCFGYLGRRVKHLKLFLKQVINLFGLFDMVLEHMDLGLFNKQRLPLFEGQNAFGLFDVFQGLLVLLLFFQTFQFQKNCGRILGLF